MTEIVWGDEIAVDGKRPKWLEDGDAVDVRWGGPDHSWFTADVPMGAEALHVEWEGAVAIRLPADHPRYATLRPATAPRPSEVGQEVVLTAEQAEMLRKTLAGIGACVGTTIGRQTVFVPAHLVSDARQALALLPEPVDADLVEARKMAADIGIPGFLWSQIGRGMCDGNPLVIGLLAGIQRGRALEKEAGR